jgi:hypothetical protein
MTENIIKKNLKSWQKVFVNRSLNMEEIKAIGFDMDHTLAIYNSKSEVCSLTVKGVTS